MTQKQWGRQIGECGKCKRGDYPVFPTRCGHCGKSVELCPTCQQDVYLNPAPRCNPKHN